ncbi:MAG: LytTR family DNA-binding domain-containing protein [Bacteroidota bacterium]
MQDFVFVRKNGRYEKIKFGELIFVKAMRGYMQVVTESQVYFVLNTIEEVEKYLPEELFCRTHRSYIVALIRIQSFDNFKLYLYPPVEGKQYGLVLARSQELPVGKAFRKRLRQSITVIPNRMGQKTKLIENAEFILEYQLEEE